MTDLQEFLGTDIQVPYISTANWVLISALFFLMTLVSVWVLFGRGPLLHFFLSSFTKPDGRADEKKLTMFSILLLYLFLHIRGAIAGVWMPEYVFWGLTALLGLWLGFAYQYLKARDRVDMDKENLIKTKSTEVKVTETNSTPLEYEG